MADKKAYTPAEFAERFGREKTWTYRLLYAGKIVGISDYGRMMIPASEAERIAGEGTRYLGKKKAVKTAVVEKPMKAPPKPSPAKSNARWADWIEKRKGKAERVKGMGSQAKRVKSAGEV